LTLNSGITYNHSKDTWDWDFGDRPTLVATSTGNPIGAYDSSDQNDDIDEYSKLKYEQYQFTVGGTYNFTEAFYTTVSGTYDKFNSKDEYVYGDEDGEAYYGYAGIGWNF